MKLDLASFPAFTGAAGHQATLLLGGDLCPINRYEAKILRDEAIFDEALQKAFRDNDFLLVYVHAGHEFMTTPSPRIRAAYRQLVDAGADAVIGHHPHVVQGAERYKDKLIAYSLGNLVFDSSYVSVHPDTDTGFLLRLGISARRIEAVELISYKLRDTFTVTTLDGGEQALFASLFAERSSAITDDQRFRQEWERNVAFRWKNEFRAVVDNLPGSLRDPARLNAPRRARNLFNCPTHVELLSQAFDMMEAGLIPRG